MGLNNLGFGINFEVEGVNDVISGFTRIGSSAQNAMDGTERLGGSSRRAGSDIGGLSGRVGGVSTAFGAMGGALMKAGGPILALAGLTTGITSAIGVVTEFEKSMSTLGALGGVWAESTEKQGPIMEALREKALQLGETTAFSSQQASQAMTILAQAGFTTGEMLDKGLTDKVLLLAQAGGTELPIAADTLGVALKAMKLPVEDAGRAVDVMAAAAVAGRVDVSDMVTVFGYAGGIAQTFGLNIEQLGAAMAVASNAGIDASTVGTSLRGIFGRLGAPTKEVKEGLDQLGLSMADLKDKAGNFRDVNDIMGMFADRMKGLGSAEKIDIMKGIAGAEAVTTFQALVDSSGLASNKLSELSTQFQNAGGSAQQMATMMTDNLAGDFDELSSAWEGLILRFTQGSGVADILRFVVQALTDALQGAIQWAKGLEASFSGFKAAGGLEQVKNVLSSIWAVLSTIFKVAFAQWFVIWEVAKRAFSAFSDVFSKIASGGAAAGGIAEFLASAWEKVQGVITFIGDIAEVIFKNIASYVGGFISGIQKGWSMIQPVIDMISYNIDQIGILFEELSAAFSSAGDQGSILASVGEFFGNIWSYVITGVMYAIDGVMVAIRAVIFTVAHFDIVWKAVWGTVVDFFSFLGNILYGSIQWYIGAGLAWYGTILGFVENVIGVFLYLSGQINSVLATIGNFFIEVWNMIAESVIVPFINFFIGQINGMGEVAFGVFNFVGEMFAEIWNYMASSILVPTINFMIGLVNKFGEVFFGVWQSIKQTFFSVAALIVGGLEGMINDFIDMLNTMISGLSSITSALGIDIGTIGKVSLGSEGLKQAASDAAESQYTPIMAQLDGDALNTTFQKAVFTPVENLAADSLNISGRFDDTAKSWDEAMASTKGMLGSTDLLEAGDALRSAGAELLNTSIMSDDTSNAWGVVADNWDRTSKDQSKVVEDQKDDNVAGAGDKKGGMGSPGTVDPKVSDNLDNIAKKSQDDARQKSKGVKIANPEEIKPTKDDLKTEVTFNQTIDGEKKRKQFILDETTKTYALVAG